MTCPAAQTEHAQSRSIASSLPRPPHLRNVTPYSREAFPAAAAGLVCDEAGSRSSPSTRTAAHWHDPAAPAPPRVAVGRECTKSGAQTRDASIPTLCVTCIPAYPATRGYGRRTRVRLHLRAKPALVHRAGTLRPSAVIPARVIRSVHRSVTVRVCAFISKRLQHVVRAEQYPHDSGATRPGIPNVVIHPRGIARGARVCTIRARSVVVTPQRRGQIRTMRCVRCGGLLHRSCPTAHRAAPRTLAKRAAAMPRNRNQQGLRSAHRVACAIRSRRRRRDWQHLGNHQNSEDRRKSQAAPSGSGDDLLAYSSARARPEDLFTFGTVSVPRP